MTNATQLPVSSEARPGRADCADCGEALREGDDVLCRWCGDNHARHPEDYEVELVELPVAVAS